MLLGLASDGGGNVPLPLRVALVLLVILAIIWAAQK